MTDMLKVNRWCNPLGDLTSQLPCTLRFTRPLTRTYVKLLGSECNKDFTLSGAPIQGTCAQSTDEDASPDYNSDVDDARFSSWALPNSLAVTRGILSKFRREFGRKNKRNFTRVLRLKKRRRTQAKCIHG
ncbi:putative transmembrane protein [Cucumis melo var. makuwa]|uniref:Transmembrane protein n=1 Tax=Cucumis melo var. makuwa TaxID=1194695 RepID=A0A5A7TF80_CUCMM|nr:putative transmembrane protein [Cucumis melo var. makuwa]TYK18035.1 putative transmembrane protein [Cucumis melo var. makuwa]